MALFFGDAGFFSVEYIIFAFRLETKEGGFTPLLVIRLRAACLLLVAVGCVAQSQGAEEGLSLTLELEHDDPTLLGVFADDLAELFHMDSSI